MSQAARCLDHHGVGELLRSDLEDELVELDAILGLDLLSEIKDGHGDVNANFIESTLRVGDLNLFNGNLLGLYN